MDAQRIDAAAPGMPDEVRRWFLDRDFARPGPDHQDWDGLLARWEYEPLLIEYCEDLWNPSDKRYDALSAMLLLRREIASDAACYASDFDVSLTPMCMTADADRNGEAIDLLIRRLLFKQRDFIERFRTSSGGADSALMDVLLGEADADAVPAEFREDVLPFLAAWLNPMKLAALTLHCYLEVMYDHPEYVDSVVDGVFMAASLASRIELTPKDSNHVWALIDGAHRTRLDWDCHFGEILNRIAVNCSSVLKRDTFLARVNEYLRRRNIILEWPHPERNSPIRFVRAACDLPRIDPLGFNARVTICFRRGATREFLVAVRNNPPDRSLTIQKIGPLDTIHG
ncbi:MAG: hypothetical protein ABFD69_01985 [Candidatus Sumerlaeia bacterium]